MLNGYRKQTAFADSQFHSQTISKLNWLSAKVARFQLLISYFICRELNQKDEIKKKLTNNMLQLALRQ
jgi:hypothetical protein